MTYVVAGASGHTGRVVAETLLEKGEKVRVIVRDPSKVADLVKHGAEVAVGSLTNEADVLRALEGAKGAYVLVPPNVTSEHVIDDQAHVTDALAKAIAKSHVPHVVLLSSIGAQLASGTGPIMTLHHAERRFSKIPTTHFTFLRPAAFIENLGESLGALESGVFPTFLSADHPVEMVATRDIAREAAALLLQGKEAPHVVELAGPEPVTPRAIGVVLTKIVGKDVAVREGPTSAMVEALTHAGLSGDLARLYREMTDSFNSGRIVFEGGEAKSLRGRTKVSEVLGELVKKAA